MVIIDDYCMTYRELRDSLELKGHKTYRDYCMLLRNSKRLIKLIGYMRTCGLCSNCH